MPQKRPSPPVQIIPFRGKKPNPSTPPEKTDQLPRDASGPPADRTPGDADNQRAMLYQTFGGRFRIDERHGYVLDGRAMPYAEVMRIAKQVRKKLGLPLDAKYWGLW